MIDSTKNAVSPSQGRVGLRFAWPINSPSEAAPGGIPNPKKSSEVSEVIDALKAANAKLIAEEAKRGGITKRIIDSQAEYLRKARAWTEIGDQSYLNNIAK